MGGQVAEWAGGAVHRASDDKPVQKNSLRTLIFTVRPSGSSSAGW
jgi:hypothetical protein